MANAKTPGTVGLAVMPRMSLVTNRLIPRVRKLSSVALLGFVLIFGLVFLLSFATRPAHALSGGSYVKLSQFPSTVAFVLPRTSTKERCTAVKVARSTFLTAAHCFDNYFETGRKNEIVFFKNEFSDDQHASALQSVSLKIVGRPQIHPSYFRAAGIVDYIKSFFLPESVDLAVFKVDRDITDVPTESITSVDVRVGLPLIIGGFGPSDAEGNCDAAPCPLRMGIQRVTAVQGELALLGMTSGAQEFLTAGDSGGPAYLISKSARGTSLHLIGINQAVVALHQRNVGKTSRITLLSPNLHWIAKAIHDVNFGT